MREKPDFTPLIGRELPSTPLPWDFVERHKAAQAIFEQAAVEHQSTEFAKAAAAYSQWASDTFLMPGKIAAVWRTGLSLMHASGHDKPLFTTQTGEQYDKMLETFETEHLGLERAPGGTRWWASSAGGSGGNYPTEAVANVINMTNENLLDYTKKHKKGAGYILAKSDTYIFAATDTRQDECLSLDGINQLSKSGESYLDSLLIAFSAGQQYEAEETTRTTE